MKKLLIVEGPAASGKSTLIQDIRENYQQRVSLPNPFEELGTSLSRPRNYGSLEDPATYALFKDTAYLYSAFRNFADGWDMALLDRGFISNAIYEGLRNGNNLNRHWTVLIPSLLQTIAHLHKLSCIYHFKPYKENERGAIEVVILLMMPPPEEIKRRRLGKEFLYPFDPYAEYEAYSSFFQSAKNFEEKLGVMKFDMVYPFRVHKITNNQQGRATLISELGIPS